jgi:hypothetical protein
MSDSRRAQEKKAAKIERDKAELQYTTAVMDGRVEKARAPQRLFCAPFQYHVAS